MSNRIFLGETTIDISKSKYKDYSKNDWIMFFIELYSGIDGSHHKDWLIDQIARISHNTPIIINLAKWNDGYTEERFYLDDPPQKYWDWVSDMKDGDDGENTYDYNFGIAP